MAKLTKAQRSAAAKKGWRARSGGSKVTKRCAGYVQPGFYRYGEDRRCKNKAKYPLSKPKWCGVHYVRGAER